jgi:hypothetical protein
MQNALHVSTVPDVMDIETELDEDDASLVQQSELRSRRKHFFNVENGSAINPETQKEFVIGDVYNNMVFTGYVSTVLVDGTVSRRCKMMSKEAWSRIIARRVRHKDNPFLVRNIVSRLLSGAKKRSKLRQEPLPKLKKQNVYQAVKFGWCQETYPPLPLILDKPGSAFSPSIDRIDSSKPYTDSNVRISCIQANMARNNFPEEDTIETCKRLAAFLIRKRDKRSNSI